MKGFIVYSTYELLNEKTVVQLFGRLENDQSFAAVIPIKPYFFIEEKFEKKHSKIIEKFNVEKTSFTNFKEFPVVKISGENHIELNKLAETLHKNDCDTYEADVKPHTRFLIDNNILGSIEITGDYETAERIHRVYHSPVIKPSEFIPKLKVISLDLETGKESGELFCIGLYGENYEKTFLVGEQKIKNVVSCKDEEVCLEEFKKEIIKIDPDIITGWNIINFDFNYLKEKFKKYKISFDIGRTNDSVRLRLESGFFKNSTADIPGRQVMDAMNMIKDPFIKEAPSIKQAEFESFSLEDVSQALLKKGKLIKGKDRHGEIEELYTKDQKKLVEYNTRDCLLAYEILTTTKMLDLAIERVDLTGLSLDRLGASVAAFDSLYIREARKRSLVSPTTHFTQKEKGITGGFVKASKPGIYHNVAILDFKSLYPSIIRTFNIDPSSLLDKKEKDSIESPNKAYFKNQEGILPFIIEKLHNAREKAKKEKRELANYAIKIIMNSFFGVLANPNCRYYNYDMANAITNFGQTIIKLTAEEIEKKGYKVIYSDTDSVFVETTLEKNKALDLGKEIQDSINSFYKDYVEKNYDRKSNLELQFAKLYLSMMLPATRKSSKDKEIEEKGAKKRYAGLLEINGEEELEITGLEAIRGDWTEAAQDFQKELLMKVFHKEPPEIFIKSYIKKLLDGKMDEKLVYRKSIRKELGEYTKTTPPHVKAARKLDHLEGNLIEYLITTDGPEPIQKLKHKIDYEHYIEKQIAPIANQVLSLFGSSLDDIQKGSKQKKLF